MKNDFRRYEQVEGFVTSIGNWFLAVAKLAWNNMATFISIFALVVSGLTFLNEQNQKNRYNQTASTVITNSGHMIITNLDVMYDITQSQGSEQTNKKDYVMQLNQIRENYKIVAALNVSSFTNSATIAYQISRVTYFGTCQYLQAAINKCFAHGKPSANDLQALSIAILFERYSTKKFIKGLKDGNSNIAKDATIVHNEKAFRKKYHSQIERFNRAANVQ